MIRSLRKELNEEVPIKEQAMEPVIETLPIRQNVMFSGQTTPFSYYPLEPISKSESIADIAPVSTIIPFLQANCCIVDSSSVHCEVTAKLLYHESYSVKSSH